MGGGIAFIILGAIFGWMVGCIPFLTVATLLWPHLQIILRILLSLAMSTIALVLVSWASAEFHNGWLFGGYLIIMVLASIAGVLFFVMRWILRKGARDNHSAL